MGGVGKAEKKSETVEIDLPTPHAGQMEVKSCRAKRIIVKAGRRFGKTMLASIIGSEKFIEGRRVLYAAPTGEQTEKFWYEIRRALDPLVRTGVYRKNEAEQYIEKIGTERRIKAKTAWNADMLRGDWADYLILDEFQLMNEDTWGVVGLPMLVDKDGDALLIFTPPSLESTGVSKAKDPLHASKLFKAAQQDTTGRWKAFHFTSHGNPFISKEALRELGKEMSREAYRKEILAQDEEFEASWLVYHSFNDLKRKVDSFLIPLEWPVYSFHDFGGANPAALFVARVIAPLPKDLRADIRQGDYVVFKEYLPGAGRSAAQHVEEFRKITAGRFVAARIGGSHQEEEIRQLYTTLGWPISEPRTKGVARQVDKVIQLFEDNRVWVFGNVHNYLEEMMNCIWEASHDGRRSDKIKDEAKYHLSACARYGFSHPDFVPTVAVARLVRKPIESLHFTGVRTPIGGRK